MTKILTIQEHNEAFREVLKEYIAKGNKLTLLHIDEHHDLGQPIMSKSEFRRVSEIIESGIIDNSNAKFIDRIVYRRICNSDYIVPLIHYKVINGLIWINNEDCSSLVNLDTKILEVSEDKVMITAEIKSNSKFQWFQTNKISLFEDITASNIIASIDLDYFLCDNFSGENVRIIITKEQYLELKNASLHKIWLMFGGKVELSFERGKYFLEYNLYDGPNNQKSVSDKTREEIHSKIKKIVKTLANLRDKLDLIIICKSEVSQYTNMSEMEYIYYTLTKELETNGFSGI